MYHYSLSDLKLHLGFKSSYLKEKKRVMYRFPLSTLTAKLQPGVKVEPNKGKEKKPFNQSDEPEDSQSVSVGQTSVPDIKHELKNAIQSRRVAHGLHALEAPSTSQNLKSTEKLSLEEEQRRRLRRERNKLAASKCRERKRLRAEQLKEEARELERANQKIELDISSLRLERDGLMNKITNHSCVLSASTSSRPPAERSVS